MNSYNYFTFQTVFTMKKNNVRSILPEDEKSFQSVISDAEKLVMAEIPISKKDKEGGKISDAELRKIPFIKTHIGKISNFLPRNFDEDEFFQEAEDLITMENQVADLERLKKNLESQMTLKRISLKSKMVYVYDASKKTTATDNTLAFIEKSLSENYEKTIVKLIEESSVVVDTKPL